MPVPVIVISLVWSVRPAALAPWPPLGLLYAQLTPLWIKVAVLVLSARG